MLQATLLLQNPPGEPRAREWDTESGVNHSQPVSYQHPSLWGERTELWGQRAAPPQQQPNRAVDVSQYQLSTSRSRSIALLSSSRPSPSPHPILVEDTRTERRLEPRIRCGGQPAGEGAVSLRPSSWAMPRAKYWSVSGRSAAGAPASDTDISARWFLGIRTVCWDIAWSGGAAISCQ